VRYENESIHNPSEFGGIHGPINQMVKEHEIEGKRFERIRQISDNFEIPPDGCNTYKII